MGRWHPWRELRARQHLLLAWAVLSSGQARIEQLPGGVRRITIDARLTRRARGEALGHELVHDEYDLLWPPDAPEAVVAAGERFVERETARRFVPPQELLAWIETRDGAGTTARHVADHFDVTEELASLALSLLVLDAPTRPRRLGERHPPPA